MLPEKDEIEVLIAELPLKEGDAFSKAFRERHNSAANQNWDTLQSIFDIHLRAENISEPFGPKIIMGGKRSMIPEDLSEEHLEVMRQRAEQIHDPEFRARIYDILWIRKRDFSFAEAAVNAYIESGLRLEDSDYWTYSIERYQRAIRLARTLGKDHPLLKKALDHLVSRVVFHNGEDERYFSLNGLGLLYEFKAGDPIELAGIAQKIAAKAAEEKNFPKSFDHYELASKFYLRADDKDKYKEVLKFAAEQKVGQAEAHEAGGSFMAAHSLWNEAIQVYRKISGSQERIKELHRRLNIAGEKIQDEMGSFTTEFDVSEWVKQTRAAFDGLTLKEALCRYAIICPLINPTKHREDCIKQTHESPLQFSLVAQIYDAAGRKVGVRQSVMTDDPEQYETAITGVMNQQAHIVRHYNVAGCIAAAMHKILEDHAVNEEDIESMISDSGFIPEGQTSLFVKAIKFGFEWDFSTALHLFIPQVENSLRYLLAQKGVITTSLDHVGIEETWPLGRILAEPKLVEIIGETLVFELRSLLLGDTGSNFRNLLAHGMLSEGYLNSHEAFYLWWVLFRMTVLLTPEFRDFQQA
ncbi:MAG: DUF4209 domain-containing protein [Alphaproteobacteria bacterium PRO2]|nr:DUF4209 domain-containing protein [Alphaproteobacteria bacterium PRO2]